MTTSIPAQDRQLQQVALLRDQMDTLAHTAAHPAAAAPSFGLFSNPFADARQTVEDILSSTREILAQLTPTTRIQTSQQAITVLNYTGSSSTVWTPIPLRSVAEAHLTSLQHTLDLRLAVAGVIASAGSALTAISLALQNPLTAPSAIHSALALKQRLETLAGLIAVQGLA